MNTNAIQNGIVPLPPAPSGEQAGPAADKTPFKNFLDRAMNGAGSRSQPEPQEPPKDKKTGKAELLAAPYAPASNPQTPARPTVTANFVPAPHPGKVSAQSSNDKSATLTGNFQTGEAPIQASGLDNPLTLPAQPFTPAAAMLAAFAGQGLQTGAANPQQAQSLPIFANEMPLPPTAAINQMQPGLLNVDEAAAGSPLYESNNDPSAAQGQGSLNVAARTQAQSQPQVAIPAQTSSQDAERLQQALSAHEDMTLKLFSTATLPGGNPPLSVLQPKGSPATAGPGGQAPADSSNASGVIHPQQASSTLQNAGKDSGILNAGTPSASPSDINPAPPAQTGSNSGDSNKNDSSPQDTSAKHSDASSSGGPGNSPASTSFASMTGAVTAPANGLSAASSQSGQAGSPSANITNLPQSALSHAASETTILAAVDNPLSAPGVVHAASLLQGQGKSEMRVALNAEGLGPLELHAYLDGGRVGASIAVVNHEAHTLLTNELPALQQVLTDQNLRVEHLSVLNSTMSNGAGTENGRGSQSGEYHQARDNGPRWFSAPSIPVVGAGEERSAVEELRRQLSVRA